MTRIFDHIRYFYGLLVAMVILIFVLPPNHISQAIYNLSGSEYRILILLVQLPLMVAWTAAMYGYRSLTAYSVTIKNSNEGHDFRWISRGMGWVAWGLPIASVCSLILNSVSSHHKHFIPAAIIIVNYTYVLISVVALSQFSTGIRNLALRNKAYLTHWSLKLLVPLFVTIGIIAMYSTVTKLQGTSLGNAVNVYYLPNWLIGVTIIIPYVSAWILGLLAAYELIVIARIAPGILYKHALQMLAAGLVLVILSLSGLQYFRSIIPRTGHLVLGLSLVISYAIYVLLALGSILLLYGAKRLQKIEDA